MSGTHGAISLMDLFKVGAHRGNRSNKLNPKLKKYVYGARAGLSLIDLATLQHSIEKSEELLYNLGKAKRQILVIGTSEQIKSVTKNVAAAMGVGMPFVAHRWLGGTLTNWATVKKTLRTLEKNKKIMENETFFNGLPRNSQLEISRETEKLDNVFGGLADLKSNHPGAIFILDKNQVAIQEAGTMNIPVIALMNTSSKLLPESLDYTMVCNNNSLNFVQMLTDILIAAYNRGYEEAMTAEIPKQTNQ
jgi:small subunit ribosomal protein S2